jgi:hypothetical protein
VMPLSLHTTTHNALAPVPIACTAVSNTNFDICGRTTRKKGEGKMSGNWKRLLLC